MPLKPKDVNKLLKDLVAYREEQGWAEKDINKLKGKASEEELAWLNARQETAKKRIDTLEGGVTKTVVRGFPQRFTSTKAVEKSEAPVKAIEKLVPLKEEPEIIEVPRSVLERINTVLEAQTAQVDGYTQIAKEQLGVFQVLKDIAEEDKAIHTNIAEITYPANGGTATIPAGTTIIDLWTGDVYKGDDTEAKLSDSLVSLGQLYVRSLHLDANKAFAVKIDDKAEHSVAANDFFSRRGIECQRISIKVSQDAAISFWASTNPDASIDETRNVVVTGVELPLSSRQARFYYRLSTYLPPSSVGTISVYGVPANKRVRLGSINITCEKSCVQIMQFSIAKEGEEFYRDRQYDIQGNFKLEDAIMHETEKLKMKIYNDTNETLRFYIEAMGLEEAI